MSPSAPTMTECDEIAASIAAKLPAGTIPHDFEDCARLVRARMPDESDVVIDNVAWSLMLCGRAVTAFHVKQPTEAL